MGVGSVPHAEKGIVCAGLSTGIGDEGGFAPNISSTRDALDFILKSIEKAGYSPGEDIISPSIAPRRNTTRTATTNDRRRQIPDIDENVDYLARWSRTIPIISIEDGMAEDDWDGWKA